MSRYYDPVTHRFINADGYFQSGGDILDTNMSAYCGNNPIMYSDPDGNCKVHKSYYVPTCGYCNPSLVKYQKKHLSWLNKVYGRNDIIGVKGSGEFVIKPSSHASKTYSTASTYLTATRGSIYTAAGYYATSGLSAAGIAGLGCVATTPFSIASHISNPYLLDGQKACPVGEELIAAAGSIALAWAIFNFWNPSGWVAIAVTVGSATLSIGTSHIISAQSRAWENENKQKWGVIQ